MVGIGPNYIQQQYNKFIKFGIKNDHLPKRFLNIIVYISPFQLFEYISGTGTLMVLSVSV